METSPFGAVEDPFEQGSLASALFRLRVLGARAGRIRCRRERARSLTWVALAARSVQSSAAELLPVFDSVMSDLRALLRKCAASDSLLDWLVERPGSTPLSPSRRRIATDLAADLSEGVRAPRQEKSELENAALLTGRAPAKPSIEMVNELLWTGDAGAAEAIAVASKLVGFRRDYALTACFVSSAGKIPISRLRHGGARAFGLLGLIHSALSRGNIDDALAIAAEPSARRIRARAGLAIARRLALEGLRTKARVLLARVDDASIAPACALLRASMDIRGGLLWNAKQRLQAIAPPEATRRPERLRWPWESEEDDLSLWYLAARIATKMLMFENDVHTFLERPERAARLLARPEVDGRAAWRALSFAADSSHRARLERSLATGAIILEANRLLDETKPFSRAISTSPASRERAYEIGTLGARPSASEVGDALSESRTFYDEGFAERPERDEKRRPLITACKIALARLMPTIESNRDAYELFQSRLRCLVGVAGAAATDVIARLLGSSPEPGRRACRALFSALASTSLRRALAELTLRFELLSEDGARADWLLEMLAAHGVIGDSMPYAWRSAQRRLRATVGDRAPAVAASFVRAFAATTSAFPDREALLALAPPDSPWPKELGGAEIVERLAARRDALMGRSIGSFIDALATDAAALTAVRVMSPPLTPPRAYPYGDWFWGKVVKRLAREIGSEAKEPIDRLRRLLPKRRAAIASLLVGAAPTDSLRDPVALGRGHALRWLDKRRDFTSFIRFADSVPCCFQSTAAMYRTSDTQKMILSLYRDPLSFCFQVVKTSGDLGAEPRGFVFGTFAEIDGRAAVALNGIYLKRQAPWLRLSVTTAIEDHFCRPLGVASVAVATRYGGRGVLPPGYEKAERKVRRLRALATPLGVLSTRIYDDFSNVVNEEVQTHSAVHFRDLEAKKAS